MGCGGGALQIFQDGIWFNDTEPLEFKPTHITLVEDNPESNVAFIAGNAYNVITFKELKYNFNDYGHISSFNVGYKKRLEPLGLTWINSYYSSYRRFPDIKMGHGVRINFNAYIEGTTEIGNFVKINGFSQVSHGCFIGDYSYISQSVVLDSDVSIGKGCYIFENSTLLPNVKIGDNTIIGAGSVVTKDIPNDVVAYGNPCKVVRNND